MFCFNILFAQPIPPDHGSGENNIPSGGGAPIDNGVLFLLFFALLYFYFSNKIKLKANDFIS